MGRKDASKCLNGRVEQFLPVVPIDRLGYFQFVIQVTSKTEELLQALAFVDKLSPPDTRAPRKEHQTRRLGVVLGTFYQLVGKPNHVFLSALRIVDDDHEAGRIASPKDKALQRALRQFSSRATDVSRHETGQTTMGAGQCIRDLDQSAGLSEAGRRMHQASKHR
jgi:hypothetical protein